MRLIVFILLSFTVSLFTACDGDPVDVTPPTLEFIDLNPAPTSFSVCGNMEDTVFVVQSGDTLLFEFVARDNEGLSQYKVDVHHNFDCHGHDGDFSGGVTYNPPSTEVIDLSVLEVQNLSGTEQVVRESVLIPENSSAGNYHFQVQLVDEAGNDSPGTYSYTINVENLADRTPPTLRLDRPSESTVVNKGDILVFEGNVSDNLPFVSSPDGRAGKSALYVTYTDLNSGNSFNSDVVYTFDDMVTDSYDFSLPLTVPNTLPSGEYQFTVRAQDFVRNVATPVSVAVQIR